MAEPEPMPAKSSVSRRLTREGRWTPEIIHERDRLLAHARETLELNKGKSQDWAYTALGDKYPPLPEGEIVRKPRGKAKKSLSAGGLEGVAIGGITRPVFFTALVDELTFVARLLIQL